MDRAVAQFTIDLPVEADVWERAIDRARARPKRARRGSINDVVVNSDAQNIVPEDYEPSGASVRQAAHRKVGDPTSVAGEDAKFASQTFQKSSIIDSKSLVIMPMSYGRFLEENISCSDACPSERHTNYEEDHGAFIEDCGHEMSDRWVDETLEDVENSHPRGGERRLTRSQDRAKSNRRSTAVPTGNEANNKHPKTARKTKRRLPLPGTLPLAPAGVQEVSHVA